MTKQIETAIVHEQVSDSEFGPPLPKPENVNLETGKFDKTEEDEWIVKPVLTYVLWSKNLKIFDK